MGWFDSSSSKNVPNTISDKQHASLSRRAQKAQPDPVSKKAVKQRLNSNAQRGKAGSS